jgi:CDP-glycerol glycerophosphotransferase (TagB/SpsB family)
MSENGYRGLFYMHPVFHAQYKDFTKNDIIKVKKGSPNYNSLFEKSSIIITDYSSIAFDFAYLKKPIIYTQFDIDEFYENHTWDKGYFLYEEDGFGDIVKTIDETVDKIIEYMENGSQMRKKYTERVDKFFTFTDKNNRKRIVSEIEKII